MSASGDPPRATARASGMAAGLAVSLVALALAWPSVIEAWLLGFVLLWGVSAGALALLLTGRILGDVWLLPIRAELHAMVDLVPMVALLAIPVLLHPEALYPWADAPGDWLDPEYFLLRSIVYLGLWIAVALLATGRRYGRVASAIGLVILIPSLSLAALDWLASREPEWISGLYGPAFSVSQLLFAMGLALLVTLIRPGHPGRVQAESLRAALLALALLTGWTWFTQFLIVWMANLPLESAWYLARAGDWLALEAIAISALLLSIVLLVAPNAGPLRLAAVSGLLVVQHLAHSIWLIRPTALHAVPPLVDIAVLAGLIGVWFLFLALELARRPNLAPETQADG